MIDLDAIDKDPWPTWPVDKKELRNVVDEIHRLRVALFWYAERYCREGFNADCCGKLGDDCSGCRARAALEREKTDD